MTVKQNANPSAGGARTAQALARAMAAAQADADRFHGNTATQAWEPRTSTRRRLKPGACAALLSAALALGAGAYLVLAPAPQEPAQSAAPQAPKSTWFTALAQRDELPEPVSAPVLAPVPAAAQAPSAQAVQAPAHRAPQATLMNTPDEPDESSAPGDVSEATGYDMGDANAPLEGEAP